MAVNAAVTTMTVLHMPNDGCILP